MKKYLPGMVLLVLLIALISPKGGTLFYVYDMRWIYIFLLSTGLALYFTPVARTIAVRMKIMDIPDQRKMHAEPMPRLGGLAVYIAFILTILRNLNFNNELKGIVIGGTIIFIIGLIDDIKGGISARIRLLGQILAVCVVIGFGTRVSVIPHIRGEFLIESMLTIIGIVGIINAFNYFDGLDGLAGSLGIVSSFCFFVIGLITGQKYVAWLAMAVLGSCLGFLRYNWKPAKIFLGDSGANFIGFNLACLAIMGGGKVENPIVACCVPLLILSIYIFDMIYTTVSRIKNGSVRTIKQWLEVTGRDHLHHRLLRLNFSQVQAVLFICWLSLSLGFSAIALRKAGALESVVLLMQAIFIYMIVVVLMLAGREDL